jgi:hypothetical protein
MEPMTDKAVLFQNKQNGAAYLNHSRETGVGKFPL